MPSGGHNTKSNELHIAQGTFRKDRHGNKTVIAAPSGVPEPPEWLSDDALEHWHKVIEALSHKPELLSPMHAVPLGRYSEDLREWLECSTQLEDTGRVAFGEKGGAYIHPLVNIRNQAATRMASFESKFGLTPLDIGRIRIRDSKPKNNVRRRNA